MATLVERVRALQGGLPQDTKTIAQLRAEHSTESATMLSDRLTGALAAEDEDAVEACLLAPLDHKVLRAAARQLPPTAAVGALVATWSRLRRRPGRQSQLALWLRALLVSQAVHLQTAQAATPVLASIAGAGSAAASAQEQLLRLSGALDLAQRIASARSGEGGARPATLELAEDETPQKEPLPQDALQDAPVSDTDAVDSEAEAELAAEKDAQRTAIWAPDSSSSSGESDDEMSDDDDDPS